MCIFPAVSPTFIRSGGLAWAFEVLDADQTGLLLLRDNAKELVKPLD